MADMKLRPHPRPVCLAQVSGTPIMVRLQHHHNSAIIPVSVGRREPRCVNCDNLVQVTSLDVEGKVVTFDSDNPQHPYAPPRADALDYRQTAMVIGRRQSGLGITSFVLAIVAGLTALALVVIAGVMEASTPGGMDEESPQAIIVGLGIFGVVALNLLGIGLGVAGLVHADRLRTFAVLGLVFNSLVILGLGGLMVIGLMAS